MAAFVATTVATMLGAVVATAPFAYTFWRLQRDALAATTIQAEQELSRMVSRELGKLLLAAILLGLVLKYGESLDRFAVLLGFLLAWLTGTVMQTLELRNWR